MTSMQSDEPVASHLIPADENDGDDKFRSKLHTEDTIAREASSITVPQLRGHPLQPQDSKDVLFCPRLD